MSSLPGPGPGEWLSFWRVTSNNSDSDSDPFLRFDYQNLESQSLGLYETDF